MKMATKLHPGVEFPKITVKSLDDGDVTLGKPTNGTDWQMVVVYRGRHCPLCTKYLNQLESYKKRLHDNKVDLVAISADSKEQLKDHLGKIDVSFPIYYGLTLEQMKMLGVYISVPRSEQETDHDFAEPGLFIINEEGNLHVVDISNNPFVRPELEVLTSGLEWIKNPKNNYPIRGTMI